MTMMMHWYLLFIIISLAACDRSSLTNPTDQIIHTLTRALHFFASHTEQVNLDAGIGTRIAADQLRPYITGKQGRSVKKLVDLSEYVTWKIVKSVQIRQTTYFAQLSFLLMPGVFSNIESFQFHRKQYQGNVERKCSSSRFIETVSDRCLHALGFAECNDTEPCIKFMSDAYACRYSLTHQILYSIIAKRSLCSHHRSSLLDEHEHYMVSRMLDECQAIADANFPESDRDLFMEQIAIGGLLGWNEFFQNKSWFDSIVSWQHPIEGCYGNDTNRMDKREEMQMLNQCLSHRTSVAVAALAEILRYLLSRDI